MNQKNSFKITLAGFAIIMMALPLFAALNSFFTNLLNTAGWYRPIQEFIVPWQAKMVVVAISPFGIASKATPGTIFSSFYMIKNGIAIPVDLSWNCLGWQSILLFFVSLIAGLRGSFSNISRVKCVVLGITGTLLVNIFRMSLIAIGIYYVNSFAAQIIHDYLAAFITLCWLMFFWWFSYKYVLEEKIIKKEVV
jgi:exosortase/archaeosortase family protein